KAMKAARPKPKLDTTFDCPFCNSEKCIEVLMDRHKKIGTLRYLHEPVDVYAHWVDQCEELNQREREESSSKKRRLDDDSVSESESGESDY
ncbi:Transcription elongation factor, putative, partial [Perkinsus marinus ATCC 50983]